jgi:septation ring formation regulator EzrA
MKYWTQLNELDEAVYKVQAVNSGLQILGRTDEMNSADSGLPEEFQTFLADLNDRMDEAVNNLKEKFQNVWDVVREDTFEDNMAAIDELEEEQSDKVRFQKIVDSIMPLKKNRPVTVIKEVDGNLTTSYRPMTVEDEFDFAWEEAKKQSER